MRYFEVLGRALARPAAASAAAAFAVRVAVGIQAWRANPLVRHPLLDGPYYLQWAREIAAGDLAGAHGIVGGRPWILNPLYAYVLAPLAVAFDELALPVILLQAALGACTAALAAAAAGRFFGRAAAWTAGAAAAFSTVLVHLDSHVSVSGLAAFLTAGAAYACAPPREGPRGPLAAGLWLGFGALARPVTPVAVPFVAWLHAAAGGRSRVRCLLTVAGVAVALALPALLRNRFVAGEWIPYTSASGVNLHLGNNPEARKSRAMASPWFRFSPVLMHDDARRFVHQALGRPPTAGEVSSYFTRMTVDEVLRQPGASAVHYAHKARWFLSPVEVPSSASLAVDRRFEPLLRAALVPTWLLAVLAFLGAALHARRPEVLLGPGALVLAHLVVLTLVFPLSHYRSPAVPAMAVLAGGAVQWGIAAWRARRRGALAAALAGAGALAAVGAAPPQPDSLRHSDAMLIAFSYRDQGRWGDAARWAEEARRMWLADYPGETEFGGAMHLLGELAMKQERWEEGARLLTRGLDVDPSNWPMRLLRSVAWERAGRPDLAETDARRVVEELPELPEGHMRLGELLSHAGRTEEARPHLLFALERGLRPDAAALRRAGL